jgi:hypothetical protein
MTVLAPRRNEKPSGFYGDWRWGRYLGGLRIRVGAHAYDGRLGILTGHSVTSALALLCGYERALKDGAKQHHRNVGIVTVGASPTRETLPGLTLLCRDQRLGSTTTSLTSRGRYAQTHQARTCSIAGTRQRCLLAHGIGIQVRTTGRHRSSRIVRVAADGTRIPVRWSPV